MPAGTGFLKARPSMTWVAVSPGVGGKRQLRIEREPSAAEGRMDLSSLRAGACISLQHPWADLSQRSPQCLCGNRGGSPCLQSIGYQYPAPRVMPLAHAAGNGNDPPAYLRTLNSEC
ncbi:hypothetical protein HJFPF1_06745 [Paramyrothecium foliicola]|nr:hypothetical protein HJFPF1_06745 [Paramyrothecium foliicola]